MQYLVVSGFLPASGFPASLRHFAMAHLQARLAPPSFGSRWAESKTDKARSQRTKLLDEVGESKVTSTGGRKISTLEAPLTTKRDIAVHIRCTFIHRNVHACWLRASIMFMYIHMYGRIVAYLWKKTKSCLRHNQSRFLLVVEGCKKTQRNYL